MDQSYLGWGLLALGMIVAFSIFRRFLGIAFLILLAAAAYWWFYVR